MDARAGEIAGLFASFAWAIGSLVYGRVQAPASSLNLFKNSVATLLFLASILVLSASRSDVPFHASREALSWLTLSSLVGLVAGDTCYFRSLQILGARRALVLTTFTPTFSAFLGWRILGENLPGRACW